MPEVDEYDPTAVNTAQDGQPPATWDPGKTTQPENEGE